jgi:hypothetical protein
MKTNIIEVGLPTDKVSVVQPALEECLIETGDQLIGHQAYDEQTLFVVRLLSDTLQCHLKILSSAFQEQMLDSFQIVSCYLFKVAFKDSDYANTLREFPFQIGESWFKSADEEQAAYLCLNLPYLNQSQTAWLATQTSIAQWTREW